MWSNRKSVNDNGLPRSPVKDETQKEDRAHVILVKLIRYLESQSRLIVVHEKSFNEIPFFFSLCDSVGKATNVFSGTVDVEQAKRIYSNLERGMLDHTFTFAPSLNVLLQSRTHPYR
jgi:hypothetical protein